MLHPKWLTNRTRSQWLHYGYQQHVPWRLRWNRRYNTMVPHSSNNIGFVVHQSLHTLETLWKKTFRIFQRAHNPSFKAINRFRLYTELTTQPYVYTWRPPTLPLVLVSFTLNYVFDSQEKCRNTNNNVISKWPHNVFSLSWCRFSGYPTLRDDTRSTQLSGHATRLTLSFSLGPPVTP